MNLTSRRLRRDKCPHCSENKPSIKNKRKKKINHINLIMSIMDNKRKISRFLMAYFYVNLMEYY